MDQNFWVLVGTDFAYPQSKIADVHPKGYVRGAASWRGSVCSDMTDDINAAMNKAEENLIANALARGANVVNNVRCVELQHANYSGIILMGDAWNVVLQGSTPNGAAETRKPIGFSHLAQTPSVVSHD